MVTGHSKTLGLTVLPVMSYDRDSDCPFSSKSAAVVLFNRVEDRRGYSTGAYRMRRRRPFPGFPWYGGAGAPDALS